MFKGWNSHVHREFPGKFEPSNVSRGNVNREIGRIVSPYTIYYMLHAIYYILYTVLCYILYYPNRLAASSPQSAPAAQGPGSARPPSECLDKYVNCVLLLHTRHILPPSEIDLGLFWADFTDLEGKHLFHRIG